MNIRLRLKQLIESAPVGLAKPFSYVPYSLRFGPVYGRSIRSIFGAERNDRTENDSRIFADLKSIVFAASEQIPFYREFYKRKGFSPSNLQSWNDWTQVPVVTKADLQDCPLGARSACLSKPVKVNTGGTSGQTLEFHLDSQAFAREWAHMHYLWMARGYRPRHLKLTFRGKHFDSRRAVRYNAVHNEYVVNANAVMSDVVEAVVSLSRCTVIRWLHGYPSLVAEFADACTALPPEELSVFRSRLFGVLLGSEYPAQIYRSVIERVLSSNIVSWYGHSEMAVLARETAVGLYESLPTYGYAEAVPCEHGDCRLVCSSLHNRVHPFIRYDTGDLIAPVSQQGGSLAFRITEGRVGDFVQDRQGRRHSLTALIFGRHHAAFELVRHLQVREESAGRLVLVVVPRSSVDKATLQDGFDLGDLDMDWRIEIVEAPVRTSAGKIRLKIE